MPKAVLRIIDGVLPPEGAKFLYSSQKQEETEPSYGSWRREGIPFINERTVRTIHRNYETFGVHFFEIEVSEKTAACENCKGTGYRDFYDGNKKPAACFWCKE